jgi:hypothetical protein
MVQILAGTRTVPRSWSPSKSAFPSPSPIASCAPVPGWESWIFRIAAGHCVKNADAGACTGSDWTWEASITEEEDRLDDELHILFVEGGCLAPTGTEWSFARLP